MQTLVAKTKPVIPDESLNFVSGYRVLLDMQKLPLRIPPHETAASAPIVVEIVGGTTWGLIHHPVQAAIFHEIPDFRSERFAHMERSMPFSDLP